MTKSTLNDIEKLISEVESAAREVTRKGGDWRSRGGNKESGSYAQFFFENWDDERITFYTLLRERGYADAGYTANYFWKLIKGPIIVSYVEGDVYIYPVKK